MIMETFAFSSQQLKEIEQFSAVARFVMCLLGPLFYCAARKLDHIRVMYEME